MICAEGTCPAAPAQQWRTVVAVLGELGALVPLLRRVFL